MGGCDDDQVTDHAAATPATIGTPTAQDEVAALCRDLIRIDTTNPGDNSAPASAPRPSTSPRSSPRSASSRRSSSPTRPGPAWSPAWEGTDPQGPPCSSTATSTSSPPTQPTGRSTPFSGEIDDGCVWGRGAVDMKDMDAMMLAVVRQRTARGPQAATRRRPGLPRRRGGGRQVRRPLPGGQAPGPLRGRHRGDRRGRRVQRHHRRPAPLPDPDRREGHGLDAADRARAPPGTAPCSTPTTRSPSSPRPSPGSAATSGRSGSPPPSGRSSPRPPQALGVEFTPECRPRGPRQARPASPG